MLRPAPGERPGLSWARPPDDPQLSKPVRWAAASAAAAPQHIPVVTILCVPHLRMGMVETLRVGCLLWDEHLVIRGKSVRHALLLIDNAAGELLCHAHTHKQRGGQLMRWLWRNFTHQG